MPSIKQVAHALVANPRVYDLVQILVGGRIVHRRLNASVSPLIQTGMCLLDLGGGTGVARSWCPPGSTYICLDIDALKLQGFISKYPDDAALLTDATQPAIRSGSMDVVVTLAVSHHLTDNLVQNMIAESKRILKPHGRLIFFDAVWDTAYLSGRLLWRYDRGSSPHSADFIQSTLQQHFTPTHVEYINLWHRYLLWIGQPTP